MEYKLKRRADDAYHHDMIVEGLEPGEAILKYFPEKEVWIFPGMSEDCQTDASFWRGVLGQLYDLYQTEMGANLKEGDTFVYEEKGWRFECIGVHVSPIKGTFPDFWGAI